MSKLLNKKKTKLENYYGALTVANKGKRFVAYLNDYVGREEAIISKELYDLIVKELLHEEEDYE